MKFLGRSTQFADMFNKNKLSKFTINDVDYDTFLAMLKFIYSGRVSEVAGLELKLFEAAEMVN